MKNPMKARGTISEEVKSYADSLPTGTTSRFDCPSCHGRYTLSITKDLGSVVYNCFKAGCSLAGSVALPMSKTELRQVITKKASGSSLQKETEFRLPPYIIQGIGSKKCLGMLLKTHSLKVYQDGLFRTAYDPRQERFLYLIHDKGKVVGAVGRALYNAWPKALNYEGSLPVPFTVGEGDILVLVEDCASASAVARNRHFTGMALLGTELKPEYLPWIKKYRNVVVALDRDASAKGVRLSQRLKFFHSAVSLWLLPKDIKDMDDEEYAEFIENYGRL